MRVRESMLNNVAKGLSSSMTQKEMIHLVRRIIPDYDLYRRMGVSQGHSIPHGDGAQQIARDMRELNYFPDFVSLMAQAETLGVHGKKYHFPRLGHVIELMAEEGLIYNSNTYSFIEDSRKSISKNWGVLREGQLAHFTILKLDLVKNTEMVRQNDAEIVNKIFSIIKQDIIEIVQSRLGRVWSWEGDGGVCAFYFGSRHEQAVYSAMEILHRIFLFNHFTNRLDRPIQLRQAVMTGPVEFSQKEGIIMMEDTIRRSCQLEEKFSQADNITVTQEIFTHLPETIHGGFTKKIVPGSEPIYSYKLTWMDPS
jgi:hypothetical protein